MGQTDRQTDGRVATLLNGRPVGAVGEVDSLDVLVGQSCPLAHVALVQRVQCAHSVLTVR